MGAYEDGSLAVYTTWTNKVTRWEKTDFSVYNSSWYLNPIIIKKIKMRVKENRDKNPDLLQVLNEKYGYTGPKASVGCPGDGSRDNFTPGGSGTLPGSPSTQGVFRFEAKKRKMGSTYQVDVSGITPCPSGVVNWILEATERVGDGSSRIRPDLAVSRWQSDGTTISFSYPLMPGSDRYQVTGTCKNMEPFTVPVFFPLDNVGNR